MMFDEAVLFTDIHFGMKNNSRQHNDDCENFITWMIEESHKRGIRKCFFLGDWHHNRASINVSTLNYTTSNLQRLNDEFDEVIMITGNHDLYYREKREIHSIPMVDRYKNIRMINDGIYEEDGVAFVPWLVEDEWKRLKELKSKFIFGHFELPNFYMNAMVQMPDAIAHLPAKMLLQVHDELLFEVENHAVDELINLIKDGGDWVEQ